MKHKHAVALMVLVNLLWSIAGVVSRQLESSAGFQITFWRSLFAALTVLVYLALRRESGTLLHVLRSSRTIWISGLMWAVMFTCFMLAVSLTRVANVLITQSLGPILTALLAWAVLHKPVSGRTWLSIAVAAAGVVSIYMFDVAVQGGQSAGVLVALGIPTAAAVNWIVLQRAGRTLDLTSAVLIGGVLSALVTLPLAWPLAVSMHDLALLALLGTVQLGIPCILVMRAARHLAAHEVALLGLLEVVFGILLAWWLGGERPGAATLAGGGLVLAALAYNELSATPPAREAVAA